LTARLNFFLLLLTNAAEGRKRPTAGVNLVRLESFVAEVCSSSFSWLDGPGTESKLLLEVESGTSRCSTGLLTSQQWRTGALLAFEGRWGGVRQCRLSLPTNSPPSLKFRLLLRNDTWRSSLPGFDDGDTLCLSQVGLRLQGFDWEAAYAWSNPESERTWNWSPEPDWERAELQTNYSSLQRVTAEVCQTNEAWLDGEGTQDLIRLEISAVDSSVLCRTGLLRYSESGFPAWSQHGSSVFTGLPVAFCRFPSFLLREGTGLTVKVIKEDVTYGPDELCLSMLKLDFGLGGQFSWRGHVWVSNTDSQPQFLVEQLDGVEQEHYLQGSPLNVISKARKEKVVAEQTSCRLVTLSCPDSSHSFTASACCEEGVCFLEHGSQSIARMCPIYSCYHYNPTSKRFGSQNGCSVVPNTWLNREACIIHDLCYMTPGANQKQCDDNMLANTAAIHFENAETGRTFPDLAVNVGFHYLGIGDSAFQLSQFLSKQTQCHQLGVQRSTLNFKRRTVALKVANLVLPGTTEGD